MNPKEEAAESQTITDAEAQPDRLNSDSSSDASSDASLNSDAAVPAPRKFKRKLTTFLAQEMLYEFAVQKLDSERSAAVEDFVAGDRECQAILESIHGSLGFAEKLAQTELKSDVIAHLRESENVISLGRRYSHWHTWPDSMRWSIVALSVSVIVASAVAMVPWQKISRTAQSKGPESVEVAKIPTESTDQLKALQDSSEVDSTVAESANEGSGDDSDVAEAGSGDTDEAGSGDVAETSHEPKLTAAQLAKQAQVEAAASRATKKIQTTTAVAETGLTADPTNQSHPHASTEAPLLLSRRQMPLISSLLNQLFVTPLGVIPVENGARTVVQQAAGEPSNVADASSDQVEVEATKKSVTAVKIAAANDQKDDSADVPSHQSARDTETDSSGDAAAPAHTFGDTEVAGATGLTASQIPETNAKNGIKPKGFVYRAFMNLDELDTLGPKITQLIQELGGVKAGEVELGWKKGNSVRYYHFSMPEDSQEKLLEQLQTYGPVRISKDPHPRIMPKGQVRFILWVESSKSAH